MQLCTLSGVTDFGAGDTPHTAVSLHRVAGAVWLTVGGLLLTSFNEL